MFCIPEGHTLAEEEEAGFGVETDTSLAMIDSLHDELLGTKNTLAALNTELRQSENDKIVLESQLDDVMSERDDAREEAAMRAEENEQLRAENAELARRCRLLEDMLSADEPQLRHMRSSLPPEEINPEALSEAAERYTEAMAHVFALSEQLAALDAEGGEGDEGTATVGVAGSGVAVGGVAVGGVAEGGAAVGAAELTAVQGKPAEDPVTEEEAPFTVRVDVMMLGDDEGVVEVHLTAEEVGSKPAAAEPQASVPAASEPVTAAPASDAAGIVGAAVEPVPVMGGEDAAAKAQDEPPCELSIKIGLLDTGEIDVRVDLDPSLTVQ